MMQIGREEFDKPLTVSGAITILERLQMDDDLSLYGDVGDLYDRHADAVGNPDHPDFPKFVAELQAFVEAGHADVARALGEELSMPGLGHRPDEAYKWYYIGLSQEGYSVDWDDRNHRPPYYCGPDGDFRNESIVSDLVVMLGWDRVRQLDQEAAQWMAERDLSGG